MAFCSNCGVQLGDAEKFCGKCGNATGKQAAPAPPPAQQPQDKAKKKSKKPLIIGGVVGVTAIALAAVLIFTNGFGLLGKIGGGKDNEKPSVIGNATFTLDNGNSVSGEYIADNKTPLTLTTTDSVGLTWTLEIPADSYNKAVTITMTPMTSASIKGLGDLPGGVQLAPDGIEFTRPAKLTVSGAGIDGKTMMLQGKHDGRDVVLSEYKNNGNSVTASLYHFSTGFPNNNPLPSGNSVGSGIIPEGFNQSRLRADPPYENRYVLTIGDMEFFGNLVYKDKDTDLGDYYKDLGGIINDVLVELDLLGCLESLKGTMAHFGGLEEMSEWDYGLLYGEATDPLGISVPALGKILDAIGINSRFDMDYWGFENTENFKELWISDSELTEKVKKYYLCKGFTAEDTLYGQGGTGKKTKSSIVEAAEAYFNWLDYIREHPCEIGDSDGVPAWEAFLKLEEFYALLNDRVQEYFQKIQDEFKIEFKDAVDEKTFTLGGVECKEKWTLNMTLNYDRSEWFCSYDECFGCCFNGYLPGLYKGEYTIDIEYDLSALEGKITELVKTPEWRGTDGIAPIMWKTWENAADLNYKLLTNPGSCFASRTIKGKAYTNNSCSGSICNITVEEPNDDKNFEFEGFKVRVEGDLKKQNDTLAGTKVEFTMVITVGDDGFTVTYTDGTNAEAMPQVKIPFDDTIWKNGNKVTNAHLTCPGGEEVRASCGCGG